MESQVFAEQIPEDHKMSLSKVNHRRITPRRFRWEFDSVPKYWFDGCVFKTRFLDVYTLLVPDNEKYYIRSLQVHLEHLSREGLKEDLVNFMRQESLHGVAHEHLARSLSCDERTKNSLRRAASFLLYDVLEKLQPKWLKTSIVSTIEHINAVWASFFLQRDTLRAAPEQVRSVYYWHFAEEIEHKCVAFDVLQDRYPMYWVRLLGLAVAAPLFYGLFMSGTFYLMCKEGEFHFRNTLREIWCFCIEDGFLLHNISGLLRYMKPGFHPWNIDDSGLLAGAISAVGER